MTVEQAVNALRLAVGESYVSKTTDQVFNSWVDTELPEMIEQKLTDYVSATAALFGQSDWQTAEFGENLCLALSGYLCFAYPGTKRRPTVQLLNHSLHVQADTFKNRRYRVRYVTTRQGTMGYCADVIGTGPVYQNEIMVEKPKVLINVHVWQSNEKINNVETHNS